MRRAKEATSQESLDRVIKLIENFIHFCESPDEYRLSEGISHDVFAKNKPIGSLSQEKKDFILRINFNFKFKTLKEEIKDCLNDADAANRHFIKDIMSEVRKLEEKTNQLHEQKTILVRMCKKIKEYIENDGGGLSKSEEKIEKEMIAKCLQVELILQTISETLTSISISRCLEDRLNTLIPIAEQKDLLPIGIHIQKTMFDSVILNFCKLFNKHLSRAPEYMCYRTLFSGQFKEFEESMFKHLQSNIEAFEEYIKELTTFRNKVVAHSISREEAIETFKGKNYPYFNMAKEACIFYYDYILEYSDKIKVEHQKRHGQNYYSSKANYQESGKKLWIHINNQAKLFCLKIID